MEGRAETILVDTGAGAHFWVTVVDTAGNESCPSNVIYLGPTTAVGDQTVDRIVEMKTYDVRGRLVQQRSASGVYWVKRRYLSGRVETEKIIVLR